MYDQFGTADPQSGFGGAGGPFGNGTYTYSTSGFDGFSDFGDLGDIFSSFSEVALEVETKETMDLVKEQT